MLGYETDARQGSDAEGEQDSEQAGGSAEQGRFTVERRTSVTPHVTVPNPAGNLDFAAETAAGTAAGKQHEQFVVLSAVKWDAG